MGRGAQKVAKAICMRCERRMDLGASFCPHCEHPSPWATYEERVAWELTNYRRLRAVPLEPGRTEPPRPATSDRRRSARMTAADASRAPEAAPTVEAELKRAPQPQPAPPQPAPPVASPQRQVARASEPAPPTLAPQQPPAPIEPPQKPAPAPHRPTFTPRERIEAPPRQWRSALRQPQPIDPTKLLPPAPESVPPEPAPVEPPHAETVLTSEVAVFDEHARLLREVIDRLASIEAQLGALGSTTALDVGTGRTSRLIRKLRGR